MFKNYFNIDWPDLLRNKAFAVINIFGLAIGIAVCLIIILFVYDELSHFPAIKAAVANPVKSLRTE